MLYSTDSPGNRDYIFTCFHCLDKLIILDRKNKSREEDAELELLLAIYKSVKEDDSENLDILNSIMDSFDYIMENNISVYRMKKILQSIDRE